MTFRYSTNKVGLIKRNTAENESYWIESATARDYRCPSSAYWDAIMCFAAGSTHLIRYWVGYMINILAHLGANNIKCPWVHFLFSKPFLFLSFDIVITLFSSKRHPVGKHIKSWELYRFLLQLRHRVLLLLVECKDARVPNSINWDRDVSLYICDTICAIDTMFYNNGFFFLKKERVIEMDKMG